MQMNEASHETEATQIDLAGYRSCRNEHCHGIVLAHVADHTGELCVDCFRGDLGKTLASIEVRNAGRELEMRRVKKKPSTGSKGNLWVHRAGNKARSRADRRLRLLFPDLHAVILAEERARFGLDPFPVATAIHEPPVEDLSQSIDFARVYSALDEYGVTDAPDASPG